MAISQAIALKRIRIWLTVVILALFVSGVTAFPLETELGWIIRHVSWVPLPGVIAWLSRVYEGLTATNRSFPFLAYGTDWLAFAHLVLAVLFVGPWRDPVRNKWVIQFGLISCVAFCFWRLLQVRYGYPFLLEIDRLQFRDIRRDSAVAVPEGCQRVRAKAAVVLRSYSLWRLLYVLPSSIHRRFVGRATYADDRMLLLE
jgi:hypothetical protein